jgi:hypothetical protein
MATADELAADKIGRAIDGQIFRLQEERRTLLTAPMRVAEIADELAILQTEKARIDPRRPPGPPATAPVVNVPPGRLR